MCTLPQGFFYLVLGKLHAADLVQYLPFPVVAGAMGVTGVSIVQGALLISTGMQARHRWCTGTL